MIKKTWFKILLYKYLHLATGSVSFGYIWHITLLLHKYVHCKKKGEHSQTTNFFIFLKIFDYL